MCLVLKKGKKKKKKGQLEITIREPMPDFIFSPGDQVAGLTLGIL